MLIVVSEVLLQLRSSLYRFGILNIDLVVFLSGNIDRLEVFESDQLELHEIYSFSSSEYILHELDWALSRMWHVKLA